MVSTPTVEERMNVVGLLEALGEGRGDEAADCILRFSSRSTSSLSPERAVAFRDDMVALFAKVCRGYHTEVSVAAVMKGVLQVLLLFSSLLSSPIAHHLSSSTPWSQLVQLHRVSIGANYAALLMNLICLDGMAQQLLPVYNVLDGAKLPLRLHRVIRRLLRILHFPSSAGQKLLSVTFPSILRMKKLLDGRFLRRLLKRIGR
jgi:hypothetical protein